MIEEGASEVMTDDKAIVVTVIDAQQAEEMPFEPDPTAPAVGRWYWVAGKTERWLGCVVHVGTNYARLKGTRWGRRVHLDHFFEVCTFEPNPDMIITGFIGTHQTRTHELMEKIREVTARLGVGAANPMLGVHSETQALTLRRNEPMDAYKTALVKAKDETLPELFKEIKNEHAALARWMKARLIPLKSQVATLKPAIKHIEDRIFSVQLYAGLTEEIVQIADGEPAPLTTKIHLFQRRAYMDEECLAAYETGGMEFTNIKQFDKWICKKKNRDRLLPFPRCILAFQVRRYKKERDYYGSSPEEIWYNFIRFSQLDEQNKFTFLYMRNGERVFRLSTEIKFEHQLFPDVDEQEMLTGKLWVKLKNIETDDPDGPRTYTIGGGGRGDDDDEDIDFDGDRVAAVIPDRRYLGMLEDERAAHIKWRDIDVPTAKAKRAEWLEAQKKLPKKKRQHAHWAPGIPNEPYRHSKDYTLFNRENVHYDDIANYIQRQIASHNRLVLVLQGILDRSPVMHPHPPWVLWNGDSFNAALELLYDEGRALVSGEAPDFELYRSKRNEGIRPGTIVIGQQKIWHDSEEQQEARKERNRRGGGRYRDITDHGPGKFAHVVKFNRKGECVFEWVRTQRFWKDGEQHERKFASRLAVPREKLFNVEAYKPGDFHIFFDDPRTRMNYIGWAPLLLESEEFHAGNRKDQIHALEAMPEPRRRDPGGSWEYQARKRKLALVGKAVRLTRDISMRNKKIVYPKGSLWRIGSYYRGEFRIEGILKDGTQRKAEGEKIWTISNTKEYDWTVDHTIPPAPKKEPK